MISFFKTLKIKKIFKKNSKNGQNTHNLFLKKRFLLLKYQLLFTFLIESPKKYLNLFLGAFIWNHPLMTQFIAGRLKSHRHFLPMEDTLLGYERHYM